LDSYSDKLIQYLESDLSHEFATEATRYAAHSLREDVLKKYVSAIKDDAEQRGLEKFLAVNRRCKEFRLEVLSSDVQAQEWLGEVKNFIYRFLLTSGLPSLTLGEILSRGKVGPGASLGAWGNDFYTKLFSSPLTCTSLSLYAAYRLHHLGDPRYESAEKLRSYSFGGPRLVPGNRLSFVPKTNDICRTICTEPTLNMFFQLGLGDWITDRLRWRVGIDLSSQQSVNRRLARIGSRTGSFSTIDLSSASDSLSRQMIREIFPRDFVAWLDLTRSPVSTLPDGSVVELAMVSTMGNGFTFPLQTLLFTACVAAVFKCSGRKIRYKKGKWLPNFAVFGDDIILPTSLGSDVIRLLGLLGFEVNSSKTFLEGPFRESCGGDYFKGKVVRPVHIRALATPQDRYVALNRLNEWTAQTGIPLRQTVQFLLGTVRFRPVPLWENADSGVRVPLCLAGKLSRSRRYQSPVYKRWVASPPKLVVSDEVLAPRRARRRIYNPYGLWITFLRGDMQRGVIPIRSHSATRYVTKSAVAPNWDYERTMTHRSGVFGGRLSLLEAVLTNLEQVC
jgi:hypothetical protein